MRALVTGVSGFVGTYLVKALEKDDWTVYPFDLRLGNDIRDYDQIRNAVEEAQPDAVFHLAAVAWPGESITDPRRTFDVNVNGALNLLEAVRQTGSDARVLLAGTSEEYGYEGWPPGYKLSEDSPCRPTTPYGVTKLAQTTLGQVYARRHNMQVVCTRAFNHTGAGRQAVNAESAFARRIVAAERGQNDRVVEHGDLTSKRNFSDVRDMVAAYQLAVEGRPGIYNVASGGSVTMQYVMDVLMRQARADISGVVLRQRDGLGRSDLSNQFPDVDTAKIKNLGWQPIIPLEQTLRELLEYWRGQ